MGKTRKVATLMYWPVLAHHNSFLQYVKLWTERQSSRGHLFCYPTSNHMLFRRDISQLSNKVGSYFYLSPHERSRVGRRIQ